MKLKHFICILFISTLLSSSLTYANIKTEQKKLFSIREQIKNLTQTLKSDQSRRQTLQEQLKHIETEISTLGKNLHRIKQEISEQKVIIAETKQRKRKYQKELEEQKDILKQQIRSAYVLGHKDYFKFLLNQENPGELNRMLNYYKFINQARIKRVKEFNRTLEALRETEKELTTHLTSLKTLTDDYRSQLSLLNNKQTDRTELVKQLDTKIQTQQERLTNLFENKKSLESLVRRLQYQQIEQSKLTFNRRQGKLHWPIQGKIIAQFGSPIENSSLTYNGILIQTSSGQSVHAIYQGKVIFAQWLRGFGLLAIIDHGQGYMTLYGRNENLYVSVGQHVKSGQVIATTGQTGGFQYPALYFAIRHNGRPLDPVRWCG